jgi:polyhydroxybutyrate depolymerase
LGAATGEAGRPTVGRLVLAAALLLAGCAPGPERLTLQHDGLARGAVLERAGAGGAPAPLLVVLHGAMLDGATMHGLTDLPARARDAGMAVLFPDSYGPIWHDGALSATVPSMLSAADDVGFLDALLDQLVADGTADPARIHLVGISNGGMMAFAYACQRTQRLASLVVFKATMPANAAQACHPSRELPVLMVAGTEDSIVRWDGRVMLGGIIAVERRLSVPDSIGFWRAQNRCRAVAPAETLPRTGAADAPHVERVAALGCAEGADTVLYAVVGGGHRLPGGGDSLLYRALGRATQDADAAALVLGFSAPRRAPLANLPPADLPPRRNPLQP